MSFNVAIVGATGAVGQELLTILAERKFPLGELRLLASARSAGKKMEFAGRTYTVEEVSKESFKGMNFAFFAAGGSTSKEFIPAVVAAGAVAIDKSSVFRMKDGVPLVVPEVNGQQIHKHNGVIASPNCSTIIMNVPVWPLHKANRVKRMVISTYQAVSGAGAWGVYELETQLKAYSAGLAIVKEKFPHQIANNLFSHDTPIAANGYNDEENKVMQETRKIFDDPRMNITITCIRVPIPRAHSESINLEFERPMTPQMAREILSKAPGVRIVDDIAANHFPMPLEASHQDDVLVGRIRQDISREDGRGLDIFISGDQVRKGAATNAVQIAEKMI
jgi:aspartate-semialdehyde dehydrogenase